MARAERRGQIMSRYLEMSVVTVITAAKGLLRLN
jgi:hypothetical protein